MERVVMITNIDNTELIIPYYRVQYMAYDHSKEELKIYLENEDVIKMSGVSKESWKSVRTRYMYFLRDDK